MNRFSRAAVALGGPLLSITISLACSAGSASVAYAQHFPSTDSLTARIRPLVESGQVKGIVLGVLDADGSRRIACYGSAGEQARPLGPHSVFETGSITKTFTTSLLADMVARGEVSLSDPVSKFLPAGVKVPSRGGRQITLLDLATHHSGLPRMPIFPPGEMPRSYAEQTVEKLYSFLSSHELRREIGAEFEYSNLGYGLLGHALSRAAGGTYEEVVRGRILEPLGMRMSGYTIEGDLARWMTKGHLDGRVAPYRVYTEAFMGTGAIRSNAEDMLTYLDANIGAPQSPLERAMRQTHVKQRDVPAEEMSIGLGWRHRTHNGRNLIWHGGDTSGYSTFIGFDPERQVGLVLMSNSRTNDPQLRRLAFELLAPRPATTEVLDLPLTADEIARYEGTYSLQMGTRMMELRVFGTNGRLNAQVTEQDASRLRYQGDHVFVPTFSDQARMVFTIENGHATGVTIHQNGRVVTGTRKL